MPYYAKSKSILNLGCTIKELWKLILLIFCFLVREQWWQSQRAPICSLIPHVLDIARVTQRPKPRAKAAARVFCKGGRPSQLEPLPLPHGICMGRTLRKEPELELNPQTLLLNVTVLTTGLNACSRTKVYASLYFHCISLYKYQKFFFIYAISQLGNKIHDMVLSPTTCRTHTPHSQC